MDEIVVFLMALPTQATLGYAQMNSSIVEKVNGVQVKSLKHLSQLLDLPAPGGTHRIEVAQQPYTMYMSQKEAAKADRFIQMRLFPCSAGIRKAASHSIAFLLKCPFIR